MADTSSLYLQMSFNTETANKPYSMSFRYPQADVLPADVDTLMDLIIAKNILIAPGGALVSIKDAGIVTREFLDLVV